MKTVARLSETEHRTRAARVYRRVAGARWPFVYRGLLPALGLAALLLFGTTSFANGWIEDAATEHVEAALVEAGHPWVRLAASGQMLYLAGTPPSEAAAGAALQVAADATCPTWLGPKTCAVSVSGAFDEAPPETREAEPAREAEVVAAAACERQLASLLEGPGIQFASGSANIAESATPLLDRIADAAGPCPGAIRIEGHTDNTGDPAANRALSDARARAVLTALVARGISADRLTTVGLGQDRPVATNDTAEGRARNRRIEMRVVPDAG